MSVFSKHYKTRFEEMRQKDLTPEQRQAEDLATANNRVTLAHGVLENLKAEYSEMAGRHQLIPDGLGIPHPQVGDPTIVLAVAKWWQDYSQRFIAAKAEFDSALQQAASLKPTDEISVNHLDGTETQRSFRVVRNARE